LNPAAFGALPAMLRQDWRDGGMQKPARSLSARDADFNT
jgi:hypothetical protein